MTITPTRFRQLLVLYALCSIAAIVAGFVPGGYSNDLAQAYTQEPEPWLVRNMWLLLTLALALGVAAVTGFIGLFLFKAWARTLSLFSTVFALVLLPLLGPTLESPIESGMSEAGSLVWGGILALAYFSPIASRFGAHAQPGAVAAQGGT